MKVPYTIPIQKMEGHRGSVRYLLTTKDGKKLLSAGADNIIKVWNLDDGSQTNTLDGYRLKVFKIVLYCIGDYSGRNENYLRFMG